MPEDGWVSAELECVICGYEWESVFPLEAPAVECPGCGHMNTSERNRAVDEAQNG